MYLCRYRTKQGKRHGLMGLVRHLSNCRNLLGSLFGDERQGAYVDLK
jgi:hypothetical protein